ncbi:type II toxin-antitoxin system RelB/DinJ family antitoxin [bacterium]|nr:type II toxin-antitoxin system RelB/DinJ family antitoxin [bacterium]
MAQTNINIRIDDKLKQQFDALCSELGLTMTAAFNIFAKAVVRQNGIPFEITLNTQNRETINAINDSENNKDLKGPFYSVDTLMDSLLNDEE